MLFLSKKRALISFCSQTFPTKYSLSALYHLLAGEKAHFYGGLDYEFVKNSLSEFAIVKENERILPFKLPKNFSNPEILFRRVKY